MKISSSIIKALNPCKERFDNYLVHYKDFEGTLADFIALENITYDDKVWVAIRLIQKPQLQKWAALCAKSVLHVFETKYPNDPRPRRAIELVLSGDFTKANAAAYAAAAADAYVAAAAYDASYVADADADAAYAAYVAVADAAYDAVADVVKTNQQNLNLKLLLEVL